MQKVMEALFGNLLIVHENVCPVKSLVSQLILFIFIYEENYGSNLFLSTIKLSKIERSVFFFLFFFPITFKAYKSE
jgi:hypothetical protein